MTSNKSPFFAPKVTQNTTLNSGLATIKCILTGYGLSVDDDQLLHRHPEDSEFSLDVIADITHQFGVLTEQNIIPVDYLRHVQNQSLPAIVLDRSSSVKKPRFLVIWNRVGPFIQIMDSKRGRKWLLVQDFLDKLQKNTETISLDKWNSLSQSDLFFALAKQRLATFGLDEASIDELIKTALNHSDWYGMAALDATIRMVDGMKQDGGFQRGPETKTILKKLYQAVLLEAPDQNQIIPITHWSVQLNSNATNNEILLKNSVTLVRIVGFAPKAAKDETKKKTTASSGPKQTKSNNKAQPLKSKYFHPSVLQLLWADDLLTPTALAVAVSLSGVGLTLQALLYRGFMQIGTDLRFSEQRLVAIALLIVFALTVLALAWFSQNTLLSSSRGLETRLRIAVLGIIPHLSYQRLQKYTLGDLTERIHTIQNMRTVPQIGMLIIQVFTQCLITALAILWLDWLSALIALLKIGVFLIVVSNVGQALGREYQKLFPYLGGLSRLYLDGLLGLIPLRTHGVERAIRREYESLLTKWGKSKIGVESVMFWGRAIDQLLAEILTALLIFLYVVRGNDIVNLPLLLYWVINLDFMVESLIGAVFAYIAAHSKNERVFEFINSPSARDEFPAKEIAAAAQLENAVNPTPVINPKGMSITLGRLDVQLAKQPILTNLNLTIEAGSQVAIVGPSGAGKSTLVGLMMGWYYPTNGYILIDDTPLTHDRLQKLRRETAWVDPALQLWNRSLLYNLNYGGGEMPIDQVLQQADLFNVLERLPAGLQTRLGEDGQLVSGGEGQRVRFGRVLQHKDVRLVILDEPFRGLDREKRAILLNRARKLWPDTTLLCVTHDVGETQTFERVLVVEGGQIVEDGPPDVLANQPNSRYKAMLTAEESVREKLWSGQDIPWRRLWLAQGQLTETDKGQK